MNRSIKPVRSGQICPCPHPNQPFPPVPVSLTEYNQELRQLPLAMAYVPIQTWGDVYLPNRALARGTLFPVLDLPFGGGDCV